MPRESDVVWENLGEIRPPTKDEIVIGESCYRRGFQQGASFAVRAIYEDGANERQMYYWTDRQIAEWRFLKHGGGFELPPVPPRKKPNTEAEVKT